VRPRHRYVMNALRERYPAHARLVRKLIDDGYSYIALDRDGRHVALVVVWFDAFGPYADVLWVA